MKPSHAQWLKRLPALFEIPAPDPPRLLRRIVMMERNIMLPVKAAFVAIIAYSFNITSWLDKENSTLDVMLDTVQHLFWIYILASLILALLLFAAERLPLAVVQWTVVTGNFVDGILVAGMALLTGGLNSVFFWLFVALIIRNSVSVPPGGSQLISNLVISLCYVLVAVLDVSIFQNLDDTTRHALDFSTHEDLSQPFVLRLVVLFLTAVCCSGLELLLQRQQLAAEEASEFAAREGQLRSAGRLAAEFAHQIKNPLAIINNTVFSLRRSLKNQNAATAEQQLEIIQEEVSRADRVITQIMGYTQLSEGRVEKLDVSEEIQRAIELVFPPGATADIQVEKQIAGPFPPLLMQRAHLREVLMNLLQNAGEAMGGHGKIILTAETQRDHGIQISVQDAGPGIAPDKLERIFEAYFSTKEKGTGLGLAIVKHNVELYGGTVRVDSALGKGAKFTVCFPAKALLKPFAK